MFERGTAMQSQVVGVGRGKLGGVAVEGHVEGVLRVRRGRWMKIESQGWRVPFISGLWRVDVSRWNLCCYRCLDIRRRGKMRIGK